MRRRTGPRPGPWRLIDAHQLQWLAAIEQLQEDGLAGTVVPDALLDEEIQEHSRTLWGLSDGEHAHEGKWAQGTAPDGVHEFLADQLRAAQRAGDAPARLHPEQEARTLLAPVEGLSIHVLGQAYDLAGGLANFDDHLDTVFTAGDG